MQLAVKKYYCPGVGTAVPTNAMSHDARKTITPTSPLITGHYLNNYCRVQNYEYRRYVYDPYTYQGNAYKEPQSYGNYSSYFFRDQHQLL